MSTMDIATLPDDVREKLAELELELSEGETKKLFFNSNLRSFHHVTIGIPPTSTHYPHSLPSRWRRLLAAYATKHPPEASDRNLLELENFIEPTRSRCRCCSPLCAFLAQFLSLSLRKVQGHSFVVSGSVKEMKGSREIETNVCDDEKKVGVDGSRLRFRGWWDEFLQLGWDWRWKKCWWT
jgi:hypothetical protein